MKKITLCIIIAGLFLSNISLGVQLSGIAVSGIIASGDSRPKILCLGDSITRGIGDAEDFGYRDHLQTNLNVSHNIVGPYFDPHSDSTYEVDHAGKSGETTAQIEARTPALLNVFFAHVPYNSAILLHAGSNDVASSVPTNDIVNNIIDIVDLINTHDASIAVYVALIIPTNNTNNTNTTIYNAALNIALLDYHKDNLYIVDMNTAFKNNDDWIVDYLNDTIHPNDAGYAVMAQTWATAINANN
jgi:lysophospholipase L1-like esterase